MTLSEPQKPAQFPSAGSLGLGDKQRRWRLPDKAADRRDVVGVFGVDKLLVDGSKLLFRCGRKDLGSGRMGWAIAINAATVTARVAIHLLADCRIALPFQGEFVLPPCFTTSPISTIAPRCKAAGAGYT